MKFLNMMIATGLGMGFSPIAPGTAGALGGCLIAVFVKGYSKNPDVILALLILLFFILGIYSSGKLEKKWGKDPSIVVIDEVVGMWIGLILIPAGMINVVAAFLLFRFLDIFKPLYIRKAELLPGGWGIMTDDAIAGIYTNASVQIINQLLT